MSSSRTLAWRRSQRAKHANHRSKATSEKREKSWKMLYLRSVKLRRAQQLGILWPNAEWTKLLMETKSVNVLFVCSRNQWRSPTGEQVWRGQAGVHVRSAGTSHSARRRVTVADIRWADLILVMEEKHKSRIKAEFREETRFKDLHVLDVPDDYQFMDSELVELLREKSAPLILAKLEA
jgi:predicted protein tyrosine phosphatase